MQGKPASWTLIPPRDRELVLSSSGASDDAQRLRRLPATPELGHDPVAVAAVDRDRELDDLAARAAGDALEEERGGVERHAECLRLLLVGDGRLHRLLATDDLEPVPAREKLVERVLLEVDGGEAGEERFAYVQQLD